MTDVVISSAAEGDYTDALCWYAERSGHAAEQFEAVIRGLAEQRGVSASKVIHPARVAVTGCTKGPSLFETLQVLRRDRVVARLRRAREIAERQ